MSDLERIAARLDDIAEELADLAIETLKDAVAAGQTARPAQERRLTQARRAVEKAAHVLRSGSPVAAGDEGDD